MRSFRSARIRRACFSPTWSPTDPRVELARSIGTRVGEGLGDGGHLGDEPMQRTLEARRATSAGRARTLRSAVRRCDQRAAACRQRGRVRAARCKSCWAFRCACSRDDEEAEASYRGALTAFDHWRGERVGVVDLGGGSTEYALGEFRNAGTGRFVRDRRGAIDRSRARARRAPAVRSMRKACRRPRAIARDALEPLAECEPVERLALVGGSATTTAAIVRERPSTRRRRSR